MGELAFLSIPRERVSLVSLSSSPPRLAGELEVAGFLPQPFSSYCSSPGRWLRNKTSHTGLRYLLHRCWRCGAHQRCASMVLPALPPGQTGKGVIATSQARTSSPSSLVEEESCFFREGNEANVVKADLGKALAVMSWSCE